MGVATAVTAGAFAIRLALTSVLSAELPYITLYPAVLASAWYGGRGPGILSSCLAALSAVVFILPPAGYLVPANRSQAVGAFLFLGFGIVLSELVESLHRARRSAEKSESALRNLNEDLAARVRDFETLLDLTPVPLLVTYDRDASATTMNAAAAAILRVSRHDDPGPLEARLTACSATAPRSRRPTNR